MKKQIIAYTLVLSIIAIIVGVSILSITQPVFFNITGTTLGWLLIVLGAISLLLSIWPYYKPSVYEVKRVSWPNKKTMLENVLSVFIFTIIFVLFFFGVDLGLKALIEWIKSWGINL